MITPLRPDPHYVHRVNVKNNRFRRQVAYEGDMRSARMTDHRSQEQRDREIYGCLYPLFKGAKGEEAFVERVKKTQAAMRWRKRA